ncbi:MAG: hypothetical protein WBB01_02910 [Phormidesmis sp.]
MRLWLTCFGVLFVGAELFQWATQLGSWPLSGTWLILGGVGLAAASNAAHLPQLGGSEPGGSELMPPDGAQDGAIADTDKAVDPGSAKPRPVSSPRPEQDSISFSVRSPRS